MQADKSTLFQKAIRLIQQKLAQQNDLQNVPQKTLKERARDNLRELGVDRDKDYKYKGLKIERFFAPSFDVQYKNKKTFDEESQAEYISNPENWVLVHATNYMPKNNAMETTAMATNWSAPRATIHFAINHMVKANSGGNWDDQPIIIIAPFNDTVKINGNPSGFAMLDTYFSPDVKTGLKLPDTARVIHPGAVPDGLLFQIKPNETIYKADNYTYEEINEILSLMSPHDKKIYDDLLNGILENGEIEQLFSVDYSGKMRNAYDKAKDKQKFLAGIMEDTRYQMLTNFVRQMAFDFTIDRMGYREITLAFDGGRVSETARDTAEKIGINDATASNKGHSNSLYAKMEDIYEYIHWLYKRLSESKNEKEIQDVIKRFNDIDFYKQIINIIVNATIEKHPVSPDNIYKIFSKEFSSDYDRYYKGPNGQSKSMPEYDKNLDATVKNYCDYQAKEFDKLILKLKEISGFTKIAEQIYLKNVNMTNTSNQR